MNWYMTKNLAPLNKEQREGHASTQLLSSVRSGQDVKPIKRFYTGPG